MKNFSREEITKKVIDLHIPRWDEIPSIELYMDQVIKYVTDVFKMIMQTEGNEKIITKAMINNYVKHKVIAPPVNKKYDKSHIVYLIVLSVFKSVFSISEISKLLKLQSKKYKLEVADNYFCEEFEKALKYTFTDRNQIIPDSATRVTDETEIVRSALLVISNKIFVESYIKTFAEEENKNEELIDVELRKSKKQTKKDLKEKN